MLSRNGRRVAALGGLILALLASPAAAQGVGQAEQPKAEQQQSQPQYADRKSSRALVCSRSANGQQDTYTCKAGRQFSVAERLWRWVFRLGRDPIAVLTLALFVIGGVQVEISRRTAMRQLRAYLFIDQFVILDGKTMNPPVSDYDNHPTIHLSLRNTGETPAHDVFHALRLEVRPVHEERLIQVPEVAKASRSYVARNGTVNKRAELGRQMAPQETAGLQAGSHAIYVIGRVEYVDAFKRKRFVNYRLKWTGAYPPPNDNTQQMLFCDEGNDAN